MGVVAQATNALGCRSEDPGLSPAHLAVATPHTTHSRDFNLTVLNVNVSDIKKTHNNQFVIVFFSPKYK